MKPGAREALHDSGLSEPLSTLAGTVVKVRQIGEKVLELIDAEDIDLDVRELETHFGQDVAEDMLVALSRAEDLSTYEVETLVALGEQVEATEKLVGEAYSALILGLPAELDPERALAEVPEVSEAMEQHVGSSPAAAAAGENASPLVRRGLSPLSVYFAAQAVADLVDRNLLSTEKEGALGGLEPKHLDRSSVVREISLCCSCEPFVAGELLDWLSEVAVWKPLLFPGFVARPEGETIDLVRDSSGVADLRERWTETRKQAEADEVSSFSAKRHEAFRF